jgi:hypothetical protein
LKTALVKQVLDVFGPWASVKWEETTPLQLFEVWPTKAVYWELTCMLQADWYVVPQAASGDYARVAVDKFPGRAEAIRKYTKNVTPIENIPFEQYDLVVTFDAIMDVPQGHQALFAYYAQEHWDRLYKRSLARPVRGYDLFLAHMMDAKDRITHLPQAVSFPYMHDARIVRATFPCEKKDSVWVDWRTLMTLATRESADPWCPQADAAAERLQSILDLPIHYRGKLHEQPYGFADPPAWADAAVYFRELAACKFFVSVGGRIGAGQGIGDAASAGCICIGQEDRAHHRLVCHPECLCADMAEMFQRLRKVVENADLQAEILAWQDEALDKHFGRGPLQLLEEARQMKTLGPARVA